MYKEMKGHNSLLATLLSPLIACPQVGPQTLCWFRFENMMQGFGHDAVFVVGPTEVSFASVFSCVYC